MISKFTLTLDEHFAKYATEWKIKIKIHYPFFLVRSIALAIYHNINLEEWRTMKTKEQPKEEFVQLVKYWYIMWLLHSTMLASPISNYTVLIVLALSHQQASKHLPKYKAHHGTSLCFWRVSLFSAY